LAEAHETLLEAGVRMAGVSVDPVAANAGMVAKLRLPFPMLSDPGGERAIHPYDLWDPEDPRGIARPAVILVDPEGEERFRFVSRDFADRMPEDDVIAAARALGLPPPSQEAPAPGEVEERPRAMTLDALPVYYRGARFAAIAMARRTPEAKAESEAFVAGVDRYTEAVKRLRDRS
jgi:hypothetical protein